jgi:SAM-dependent methyltransferase
MKVRESGMPNAEMWEGFFKPYEILKAMGIDRAVKDAAEFGCGYGTFTIPVAKTISGRVFAMDIEREMVDHVMARAQHERLSNVDCLLRDFIADGTGLGEESVDYVMLFNIMHDERPERIIKEAYRIAKPGGRIGIIHWNYDSSTPRGPPMAIRPKPEQCVEWAVHAGLKLDGRHDLRPYHYGLVFLKN